MSRTAAAARNSGYAILQRVVSVGLSFVNRTAFIYVLGVEYLGVNGLFASILVVLSFAELGMGSAITFSLYKPLADGDRETAKGLIRLYRRIYRVVGIFIALVGVGLIPVLPRIINNYEAIAVPHLNLIYLLVLANTVVSYFFSHKRALLTADQKEYLNTRNSMVFGALTQVAQVIVLVVTHNYILYLAMSVLFTVAANAWISRLVDRLYPSLVDMQSADLPRETQRGVVTLALASINHKVGQMVVNSTDNVVISALVGIGAVGMYSNYLMILGMLDGLFSAVGTGIVASVGNLHAVDDREHASLVYDRVYYLYRWIYITLSVVLFSTLNRFIMLWAGNEYVFSQVVVGLLIANFYVSGMRHVTSTFISASGLYYRTRFRPLWEAAINLAVSIGAAVVFGVAGVFAGTLVAYLSGSIWYDPRVLFRDWFGKSTAAFFAGYFRDSVMTAVLCALAYAISQRLLPESMLGLVGTGVVSLAMATVALAGVYGRQEHRAYYAGLIHAAYMRLRGVGAA